MFIRYETAKFALMEDRFGFVTLVRKADGATAFFQGDDASLWDRNMTALEALDARGGWCQGNSMDQSFNYLCDGYDTVMDLPGGGDS